MKSLRDYVNEAASKYHWSTALEGKYKESKPPKYKPSDFKIGEKIKHADFPKELTVKGYLDDRDYDKNGKIDSNALYLGGIKVVMGGSPNEYHLWYDTETLRQEKRVGGSFYKITKK